MCKTTKKPEGKRSLRGIRDMMIILIFAACVGFAAIYGIRSDSSPRDFDPGKEDREEETPQSRDGIKEWLLSDPWDRNGENNLGITVPYQNEMYYVQITGQQPENMCLRTMVGTCLEVVGEMDTQRDYFEGRVKEGSGQICLVNFQTMEYVLLNHGLRSIILGDFFVSCHYVEDAEEYELLVFYCPPE